MLVDQGPLKNAENHQPFWSGSKVGLGINRARMPSPFSPLSASVSIFELKCERMVQKLTQHREDKSYHYETVVKAN